MVHGHVNGVIGQGRKIGVGSRRGQDLGVSCRDRAATLALKRSGHDGSAAALLARLDDRIDEVNEVIAQPDRNLFAHTKMVPLWDAHGGAPRPWVRRARCPGAGPRPLERSDRGPTLG